MCALIREAGARREPHRGYRGISPCGWPPHGGCRLVRLGVGLYFGGGHNTAPDRLAANTYRAIKPSPLAAALRGLGRIPSTRLYEVKYNVLYFRRRKS